MATSNKPADKATPEAEADKGKTFVAIFTPGASKGPKVELFKTLSDKARAPVFDGQLDGQHVSAFLRAGKNGPFLSLVGDAKDEQGHNKQIATARVVSNEAGVPKVAIQMVGAEKGAKPLWASISKKVDDETLVKLGLDAEKQATKRAAKAAAAVDGADKKKPAPKA